MDVVRHAEHRRRPQRLVVLARAHLRVARVLRRAAVGHADDAHLVAPLGRVQAERPAHPEHLVVGVRREDQNLHPSRAPTGSGPARALHLLEHEPALAAGDHGRSPSMRDHGPGGGRLVELHRPRAPDDDLLVAEEGERARVGPRLRAHPVVEVRRARLPVDDPVGRRPLRPGARAARVLRRPRGAVPSSSSGRSGGRARRARRRPSRRASSPSRPARSAPRPGRRSARSRRSRRRSRTASRRSSRAR